MHRKGIKSTHEWMDRLHIKVMECTHKECDRQVKEQFINSIDNEEIMQEIITELTAHTDMRETESEQVLMWAQRVEMQRVQKKALDEMKCVKGVNTKENEN